MDNKSLLDLLYVVAFFFGGHVFAIGPFIIAHLLASRSTRNYKQKTDQLIECGMAPIGDAWIRFGINYYLYALIFIAFAVDVLFLFPVAIVYNDIGSTFRDFIEILIFVGILALVIIYAWKKGVFKWERKIYNNR